MTSVSDTSPAQAFWEFSLRVYAAPGVPEECLALQERYQLDVNLLLFAAYAGSTLGRSLSRDDLAAILAETQAWHVAIVRPLRAVRTQMKKWSEDQSDDLAPIAANLRLAVKRAELEAERYEHERLGRWLQTVQGTAAATPRDRAASDNIRLVLGHYGADESAPLPRRLIDAALG